jgi:hypothetical protein
MTPNLHNDVGDGVLGGRRVTANNECQPDQPVQLDLVVTSECRNVAHDMDLRHRTCSWRLMPSASLHHTGRHTITDAQRGVKVPYLTVKLSGHRCGVDDDGAVRVLQLPGPVRPFILGLLVVCLSFE